MTSSATRATSMQASGSDQRISSVHSLNVEKREVEENLSLNRLKAIAKIKEVPNGTRKELGEIVFEENQVILKFLFLQTFFCSPSTSNLLINFPII